MSEPTLFNDEPAESEQNEMPLATAADLFLMRWVPPDSRNAARKALDDLIDLACRVEPPA